MLSSLYCAMRQEKWPSVSSWMTWELFSGQCEVDAEGRQQSDIQREAASLQNKISQFWDDWGHGHRLWVNSTSAALRLKWLMKLSLSVMCLCKSVRSNSLQCSHNPVSFYTNCPREDDRDRPGSMCLKSSLVRESLRRLGLTSTLLVSSVSPGAQWSVISYWWDQWACYNNYNNNNIQQLTQLNCWISESQSTWCIIEITSIWIICILIYLTASEKPVDVSALVSDVSRHIIYLLH